MKQIDITCISTASVAKLGGVTPSRIRQLNMDGLISPTKIEAGRHFYDAAAVLRALERIRSQDANNPATAAKIELVEQQARGLKLANDFREDQVAPIEDTILFTDMMCELYIAATKELRRRLLPLIPKFARKEFAQDCDNLDRELIKRRDDFKREIAAPKPEMRWRRR